MGRSRWIYQRDAKPDTARLNYRHGGNLYRDRNQRGGMYRNRNDNRYRKSTACAHRFEHRTILRGTNHTAECYRRRNLFVGGSRWIYQRDAKPDPARLNYGYGRNLYRDCDQRGGMYRDRNHDRHRKSIARTHRFEHGAILRGTNHTTECYRRRNLFMGWTGRIYQRNAESGTARLNRGYGGNLYRDRDQRGGMYRNRNDYRYRKPVASAHCFQHGPILRGTNHTAECYRRRNLFMGRTGRIYQCDTKPGDISRSGR